jgi:hypothetical protein
VNARTAGSVVLLLLGLACPVLADYDPLDLTPGSEDANRWRIGLGNGPGAAAASGLDTEGSIAAILRQLGFGGSSLLSDALGVPEDQRGVEPFDLLFGVTAKEAAGSYGETPGLVLGISTSRGASGLSD